MENCDVTVCNNISVLFSIVVILPPSLQMREILNEKEQVLRDISRPISRIERNNTRGATSSIFFEVKL